MPDRYDPMASLDPFTVVAGVKASRVTSAGLGAPIPLPFFPSLRELTSAEVRLLARIRKIVLESSRHVAQFILHAPVRRMSRRWRLMDDAKFLKILEHSQFRFSSRIRHWHSSTVKS